MPYIIEYSPEAEEHLQFLTVRQQRIVVDAVERQLVSQPTLETRNRKPMRLSQCEAPTEPRDSLTVYYDVEEGPERRVVILAIGKKERNRVRIAGEIIDL